MKKVAIFLAVILVALGTTTFLFSGEGESPENGESDYSEPEEVEIDENLIGDWQWVETIYNDGREVRPDGDDFVLTFNENGSMSSTTDCNGLSGQFNLREGNEISFSEIAMTKMYCEDSLEDEYLRTFNDASTYLFEDDNLVITIKYDSGSTIFEPVE